MPKKAPSRRPPGPAPTPRPRGLDEVDALLVELLARDGRSPNTVLARAAGIAESTCIARVRALRERGVIRGIHADIDPAALGRPVQAMVAVRFGGHQRDHFEQFRAEVPALPGVLATFHLSGATDYLVHVAAESSDALRDFVLDHLTNRPGVVHAETSLVFEALPGTGS
ncbi:MAG TPA: Lrp/AsnC family transcriptional regulator, partial [Segeticoccus sp.]|uniref:Lrp/AsnC family transcriptional regulator n=1 Tax=Segeticoccus sp. TaxID=2706531 RepID=UPI002D7F4AD3